VWAKRAREAADMSVEDWFNMTSRVESSRDT
jgi:hypothetical protein